MNLTSTFAGHLVQLVVECSKEHIPILEGKFSIHYYYCWPISKKGFKGSIYIPPRGNR